MISVTSLTVAFGKTTALDGIEFNVPPRAVYGFLGPNGAGKTTTIKVLATLLKPDAGTVSIDGLNIWDNPEKVRGIIGYMPDFFGTYEGLTVREYLELFSAFYGKSRNERRQTVEDILELTDLISKADDYVDNLSRGVKQRLGLGRALVNDPRVLLLDEPASGLDPRARVEFKAILRELGRMGKTIFISSHILSELEDLCTSVGVIESGAMLFSGGLQDLKQKLMTEKIVEIRLKDGAGGIETVLEEDDRIESVTRDNSVLRIRLKAGVDDSFFIARTLMHENIVFLNFNEKSIGLEEAFMQITRGLIS